MHSELAIEDEIRAFLGRNFPLAAGGSVDSEQSLVESGVIDSLGVLEVVGHIEEHYGLRIPEDELLPENFDSISNMTRYISSKLERDRPGASEASPA